MKRFVLLSLVILLSGFVFGTPEPGVVAAETCTTTLNPGDDIQTAINNATSGDVICLNPGLYSPPAKININKSITLQGPQAGIDPRPSAGTSRAPGDASTEAIIDGASGSLSAIIVITADNVILDGLEVRNGSGDMIDSESGTPTVGTIVRYNIIDGATGDEGMQIRNVANAVIEYNYVFDIAQDGINLCCGSDGGSVRFNEVHDNNSENAAIYIYDATNTTIQCNLVYDVHANDGIKLGTKGGGDADLLGGSILYNTVYNTAQDGIAVYMSDTLVEGNEIYNSSSENGAIYLAYAISNVTVTLNDVHDNTLADWKWGDPGAIMIGTAVDAATVHVNSNNIHGNTPNGLTNKATAPLDATENWWGDLSGPDGAGPGSGDAVSANVDFDAWLDNPVIIDNPCAPVVDEEGPITSNVATNPNPVAVSGSVQLTAFVDDTDTGGSNIASADYRLDGGTWTSMSPQDGDFDDVGEEVKATVSVPAEAGIYDLCVRGTDVAENTGPAECIMLVVYDPDGGFVTGGGWIDSPPGAYLPPAGNYFIDTFDTDPPLADTATEDAWYPDRYAPAAFESVDFDGDNRLRVHISQADYLPYGSTFYNYQGRKYDLWNPVETFIMGDLYVGLDWTQNRHASIWATTFDENGEISGYPIIGFTAGAGFRIFTQDQDQDTSNGYQAGWYDIGYPDGFEYGHWYTIWAELSESAYRYYLNGELVWTDAITFESILWGNMMLQAYNYGANYDVYWDNVGAWPMGPVGKANFGFVSKYKKGADTPTGNTEFVFQAADLNFHSSSYDWLVVTGSDYARFKGLGTINGEGEYKFMLWAGDGTGDDGADTFRIKIWSEEDGVEYVVYDNGMDQEIGGGSIVVHTKKK